MPNTGTNNTAAKTATRMSTLKEFYGSAALYRLDDTGSYVVVSAIPLPETLVFPANATGEVTDWGQIGGGRGYMDHGKALATMGYEVQS